MALDARMQLQRLAEGAPAISFFELVMGLGQVKTKSDRALRLHARTSAHCFLVILSYCFDDRRTVGTSFVFNEARERLEIGRV